MWSAQTFMLLGLLIAGTFVLLFRRAGEKGARVLSIVIAAYLGFGSGTQGYLNGFMMVGCALVALAVFYTALRYRHAGFMRIFALAAFLSWSIVAVLCFTASINPRVLLLIAVGPIVVAWLIGLAYLAIRQWQSKNSKLASP